MRPLILAACLALLALGGCSSMLAGLAVGGAGGLDGPGAGAVKITDCDGSAQGSVTAMQVEFTCSKTADGGLTKRLSIGSVDPGQALAKALDAQAQAAAAAIAAIQQLAPLAAQAAATAAAGPVAGEAAKALLTPKTPSVTPAVPLLPGPAAQ